MKHERLLCNGKNSQNFLKLLIKVQVSSFKFTIQDKIFGIKWTNPVKLDRTRKV